MGRDSDKGNKKPQKFTYKSNRRNTERKETFNPRSAPKRTSSATWDDAARQSVFPFSSLGPSPTKLMIGCGRDYLTGFSKRKKAKKEFAQKKAAEAARVERNELRAQVSSYVSK